MRVLLTTLAVALTAIAVSTHAARADATLERVRAAKLVTCATVQVQDDFTKDDTHGSLEDFTVDVCHALAAAVLGDAGKIHVILYPDETHALKVLQAGGVDVMIGASPSADRATHFGVAFAPPAFYDGQSFMVDRASGITSFAGLAGKPICYISGTENERRLLAAAAKYGVALNQHPFEEVGELEAALVTGHCAAMTADVTQLAEGREGFHSRGDDFVILPDLVALDPVTPAYAQGDTQWGAVIGFTLAALIQAEDLGLTQATIATAQPGDDPVQRQILGATPGVGRLVGLPDDWARKAVLAVGNYGEMFERDLGAHSSYRMERGVNRLWRDGGLLWAPPLM